MTYSRRSWGWIRTSGSSLMLLDSRLEAGGSAVDVIVAALAAVPTMQAGKGQLSENRVN